ncbi:MAG TPA: DUF6188 family protein [Thermoanaerobaculia bacterium]|nr:DUF6188 family protein [Thermoanaerobaculia bacterium]
MRREIAGLWFVIFAAVAIVAVAQEPAPPGPCLTPPPTPARWVFAFHDGGSIAAECPWRLIVDETIAVSSDDHGRRFGLPSPVDAAQSVRARLAGDAVVKVMVQRGTADLSIAFASGSRLELLVLSSGFESWEAVSPTGALVIAQARGDVTTFS